MNKPKFDPTKPYEEVKPKFDPNQHFEVSSDESDEIDDPNRTSKLESAARGFVQGIPGVGTWADEATGAIESAFSDKTYEQARDESRAAYKKAEDDNPATYMAGVMAPSFVTAPFKELPVIGTAASAGLGALEGAGASEAEDIAGIGRDAAITSGISAATAGLGHRLMKPGKAIVDSAKKPGFLRRGVDAVAMNATGATPTQTLKYKPGASAELVDKGLISFGEDRKSTV